MADVTKKVATSLDMLLNELKNFKVDSLASAPTTATAGQMYFNTGEKKLYYGAGDKWNPIATGESVTDALNKLNLTLAPETEHDPKTWKLELNGTGASVDVTDMMKDSSVARIVSFLPSEGTNPSDGRVSGVYNKDNQTFTLYGTSTVFNDVTDKDQVYLGLVLDNYGGKFGNISNRYVGLAINANLFNGINRVTTNGSVVALINKNTLAIENTEEVEVSTDTKDSSSDINFAIGKISADKIVHEKWVVDPSQDETEDSTPKDTKQSTINESLRDAIAGVRNIFDDLSLELDGNTLYFTYGDGDKINGNGFDVSDFVKDGMLKAVVGPYTTTTSAAQGAWSVEVPWSKDESGETVNKKVTFTGLAIGKTYLGFIWDTNTLSDDDDPQTTLLDVSTLVNIYTDGNGLDLTDGSFSIDIDTASDSFLSVGTDGLRLSGVQTAIDNVTITHKTQEVSITSENTSGSVALTKTKGTNYRIDPSSVRASYCGDRAGRVWEEIVVYVTVSTTGTASVSWTGCPEGKLMITYHEFYDEITNGNS